MKKLPMSISGAFSYQIDAMENHCRKKKHPVRSAYGRGAFI